MKKINIFLAALAGLMMASCDNDPIDIAVVGTPEPTKELTLNISTSSTYDGFNNSSVAQKIRSGRLNDESYYVGVTTLVYNQMGELVDTKSDHVKTLSTISMNFELDRGQYTIVTVQTLVNSSYGYTSEEWELTGTNNYSTLAIVQKQQQYEGEYYYSFYQNVYDVVGYSVMECNLTSDTQQNISPAPLGALVEPHFLYFERSGYYSAAFFTKDKPIGMKLRNDIGDGDRYIYNEYEAEHTWDPRATYWIEKGDGDFIWLPNLVYIMEQGNVSWMFAFQPSSTSTNIYGQESNFSFKNGHYYYGGFAYVGPNYYGRSFLGESESEYNTWYNSVEEPQRPASLTFKEPYMNWGASVSTVKSYMSGYTLLSDIQASSNDGYYMQYSGKDDERFYEYDFTSMSTGLKDSYVVFNADDVSIESIASYFSNSSKFESLTYNSSNDFYGAWSTDGKTGAIVYSQDGLWIVNFYDGSAYSRGCMPNKQAMRLSGQKDIRNHSLEDQHFLIDNALLVMQANNKEFYSTK